MSWCHDWNLVFDFHWRHCVLKFHRANRHTSCHVILMRESWILLKVSVFSIDEEMNLHLMNLVPKWHKCFHKQLYNVILLVSCLNEYVSILYRCIFKLNFRIFNLEFVEQTMSMEYIQLNVCAPFLLFNLFQRANMLKIENSKDQDNMDNAYSLEQKRQ